MLTPTELIKLIKSEVNECNTSEINNAIVNDQIVVDVREPAEFSQSKIEGAINIPRGLLEFSLLQNPLIKHKFYADKIQDTPIFLYCQSGGRSALAAKSLQDMGFVKVYSLVGGIKEWLAQDSMPAE